MMQALNRLAQKLDFGVLLNHRVDQAMKVMRRNYCQPILACATLLALVLSSAPIVFAADPIGVFVSILPQKQFVERIGGDAVKVQVMVRPGESPATYDPTPQQMVALAGAAAYFRIGVPFENVWIPKIQNTQPQVRIVDTREGIELQPMGKAGHAGDHDHDAQSGSGGALDPHIWTSPPLVKQQAATIRDALIALRPAERARFEAGYAAYAAELDALDAELRQMLAGKTERRFMVFHPAWGYLAHSYGLEQIPIEAEGKDPGPKALAKLIEHAKTDGVRVIFVQKQFGRSAADAVAEAIGGEVIVIDPLAEDFLANTRAVAQTLARALK